MFPLLVYLSVVSWPQVLTCVDNNPLHDISDDCYNGRNISVYLTTGMGLSDACVIMIARPEEINCTMHFIVSTGHYIIIVVEFLDWMQGNNQCGKTTNKVDVMVSKHEKLSICNEVHNTAYSVFRYLGQNEMSVNIVAHNDLDTIKVIATSLRDPLENKCDDNRETECKYKNHIYCMTKIVLCDGNVNCGVRDEEDEDKTNCAKYRKITAEMVIFGIGSVFITFILLVALIRNLLPSRKGTFVFKEDETLSDRDRANSQKDFDISLKVLYHSNEAPNIDEVAQDHHKGIRSRISFRKIKINHTKK